MNLPKENLPSSPRKNRKLAPILGGMTILGMLALIGLVLLSNFPAQRRAAQTNPKPHRKTLVRRSPKHPAPSTTS
jgi:hypothetical protein